MNWVEIKVKTTTEAIEAVSNIFFMKQELRE